MVTATGLAGQAFYFPIINRSLLDIARPHSRKETLVDGRERLGNDNWRSDQRVVQSDMPDATEPEARPLDKRHPWRDRWHEIVFEADTPAGKAFDVALLVTILASVVVVILSTMTVASEAPYRGWFLALEWGFTALFTAEYILRLLIVRKPLRYASSFFGIIDLLAILPAFIGLIIPGGERLLVVRTLRLLRIFRIFKLTRYLSEGMALRRAIYTSRHKIAVFLVTVLIVVLIASAIMHIVEGNAGNEPFNSMPTAMYWSIITMTTVGYGDIIPTTSIGKATTAALVLVGYSLIIVPTGILGAEIAGSRSQRATSTQACPSCMLEGHDIDAVYCKRCGERLNPDEDAPG
jgi:voltage-gated potassium channel